MNTFSHIMIADLLCIYLKRECGIRLNRTGFVRGNYLPDFSIDLLINPHYMRYKLNYVEREIAEISALAMEPAEIGREHSKRLGILCHYIADFFCFAHCDDFGQNMAVHVDYERRLHRVLATQYDLLRGIRLQPETGRITGPGAVCTNLRDCHSEYCRSDRGPEGDIAFTLQVCMNIVTALVRCGQSACTEDVPGVYSYSAS